MSYGIVANVLSDRALRTGAKVWLLGVNGDAEHPFVKGLSKSGRPIKKYTSYKRLANFRAAWMPPHVDEANQGIVFETREEAQEFAEKLRELWSCVRYFNCDGTVQLKDGESVQQAFNRLMAARGFGGRRL